MAGYSWLADKKREAMMEKMRQRGTASYRQTPMRERYGVEFTGAGPDGQIQEGAPAGISGRKNVFHEGEYKANLPEGEMYVNARTARMMNPQTEQDQAELDVYAKKGNLPGYRTGGANMPIPPGYDWDQNPNTPSVDPNEENAVPIPRGYDWDQNPNQPNFTPYSFKQNQQVVKPAGSVQNLNFQTPTPRAPTVKNTISTTPAINVDPNAAQSLEPTTPGLGHPPRPEGSLNAGYDPNEAGTPPVQTQPVQNVATPAPALNVDPNAIARTQQTLAGRQPVTTPAETTPPESTLEDKARQDSMQWLLDAMNGINPAMQLEGRKAAQELASKQQQERSAFEQQMAQQGVDPGRARVEAQMLRDKQESEQNNLAAKFGIAGMQARQNIAQTVAGQALAGQQFETQREQYKDNDDWKAYEAAIAAGDFDTAAKAYQRVTGQPISMDQMTRYQNYLNTKQEQDITVGNLNITQLQNQIGAGNWGQMNNMINTGADITQVNDFLTSKGMKPLTEEQFAGILDATPLGERTFERNITAAGLALKAGGAANIKKAAQIYNNAFPGLDMDFENLITEDKAATFGKGMESLSKYVAAGMDYDDAIAAMRKDGTLDFLGMDEKQTEQLYRGLKVNAIDEQWKQVSESEWYQGLPEEDKKDMQSFFSAVLSGKLDYSVMKEYTYTDKAGNTVTKRFKTEKEAAAFATANGVTLGEAKSVVVPASMDSGTPEETPPKVSVSTPTNKKPGDIWVSDDGILRVAGNDGSSRQITPGELSWDQVRVLKPEDKAYTLFLDKADIQFNPKNLNSWTEPPEKDEVISFTNLNGVREAAKVVLSGTTTLPNGKQVTNMILEFPDGRKVTLARGPKNEMDTSNNTVYITSNGGTIGDLGSFKIE